MLEIKQITKTYEIGKKKSKNYQTVQALKGVDIAFRESEFVSILGPSGCGKTTLLNIIGGLDKYTSGDLIINDVSTKQFKDKNWDNYRNHSVGFVFQSYNLISHQTILQNVELALTLSGVKSSERHTRALEALDKVGLKDRAHNKPNQLSGGQMQRVAIARAIVNDPDIILADEPTGALDSKTSVQIMEILKELAKDRLVVMVTHNPDLAKEYSSRIITLKDGELVSDSNPYTPKKTKTKSSAKLKTEDNKEETLRASNSAPKLSVETSKTSKKPKKRMSFFTALGLSFKNLLTKKARTILVAFAGSIGIIGIALILSVSSGFNNYMKQIQEDTLSSYPIVIEEQSMDFSSVISSMFSSSESPNHSNDAVYPNDSFVDLLESFGNSAKQNNMAKFNAYLQEHYDEKLANYVNAIQYGYSLDLHIYQDADTNFENLLSPTSSTMYDLIAHYTKHQIISACNLQTEPVDASLGLIKLKYITSPEDIQSLQRIAPNIYNDLLNSGEHILTKAELYSLVDIMFSTRMDLSTFKTQSLNMFSEIIDNDKFVKSQYDLIAGSWNGNEIKVDSNGDKYCDTVLVLNKNNEVDDYVLYALGFISQEQIDQVFASNFGGEKPNIKIDYSEIIGSKFKVYLSTDTYELQDNEYKQTTNKAPIESRQGDFVYLKISGIIKPNKNTKGGALNEGVAYPKAFTDYCITQYNASDVVNPINLDITTPLKPIDKNIPSRIAIYANSFDVKEVIEEFITSYNAQVDNEDDKITYNDTMGLLMGTVGNIMDTVTYVLIAFVSVSLIVSSIMIGIITYISVLERTKEIGVLRSVGASKRDIKRVFTAESLIIGFAAGLLGILITLLLCIPINIIFKSFTGISTLAMLPVAGGVILVLISMLLTFVAGLIPAQVASKKDPVIALRTE